MDFMLICIIHNLKLKKKLKTNRILDIQLRESGEQINSCTKWEINK